METPSERVEILRSDAQFVLSRRQTIGDQSLLSLSAVSTHSPSRCTQQLQHEFSLRDQLDPSWAIRPLALAEDQGCPTLTFEDPRGRLLSQLVGRPWDAAGFLRVAIGMAAALRQLHGQGLVHKNLKPGNVMTNRVTGQSWLTGFGIASRLPRERRAPDPPHIIAGSLEYMAPEQTGRMNRSVDSRSDLYSLGVTFYEMLTGELPFAASDPMGWVHCHIARQAPRADERHPTIPRQLGSVVAKLLAKAAESRYQTAAGLEADLRRCLDAIESSGSVDLFMLGAVDVSDRLLIPERLYGRDRDVEILTDAFDRVVASGAPEVVLVSGYSGIGKSSVVNELHKSLVPPHGLFASGKFDQYKRDIPYATIAQAMQQLVRMILVESDAELARWRAALQEAVGPNGTLIANLIPELELIIGPSSEVPELPPIEAQNRFQLVFRDFIAVFARPEHPLALFIDDLQWLDIATLKLLETLMKAREEMHLLLVGAYRSNEVHAAHPLMPALDAIRASGVRVHELLLAPLDSSHVEQLVADALRAELSDALPLGHLVYEKAGGNPFFTIEFLGELADERLVAFDPSTRRWRWDVSRIEGKGYTNNVVDLMAAKLIRLSPQAQGALKDMACLGNRATATTMALVRGSSEDAVEASLSEAVQAGVVLRVAQGYGFVHDRVHEAAYSLIRSGDRAQAHLQIGRLLLSNLPSDAPTEALFGVVSQFGQAIDLVVDLEERATLRRLNVRAGKKARDSIAYPLDQIALQSNDYGAFAKQSKNDAVYQVIRLEQQFVASLQGRTDDPLGMSDASFDEAQSIASVLKATFGCGIALYYVMKQILAFLQGRHVEALAAATSAEPYLGSAMSMAMEAAHHLFYALTVAALDDATRASDRERYDGVLSNSRQKFALWAEQCPENFGGRYSLLLAEIARVEGRALDAMPLYEAAIEAARRNGLVQDEALACELAAKFYEGHELYTAARAHFRDACEGYARWGAHSKVQQLEKGHAYLREEPAQTPAMSALGTPVEHLDLATIVRVLRALTGDIQLERWVGRFMTLALEDAGAQRGVLLLPQGGSFRCLAEANTALGGVEVHRVLTAARSVAPAETKFAIQLNHAGRKASDRKPWETRGVLGPDEEPWPTVAPSALPWGEGWHTPDSLTSPMIHRIREAFVSAAMRAVRVGFDVVEIHLAHGYLLHQFHSPIANQRNDNYGGDAERRRAFPRSVVRAVRAALPASVALGARVTAKDWCEGGLTLDEAVAMSAALQDEGADFVCVSSGGITGHERFAFDHDYQVSFAARIRREVSIRTRAVGMIATPERANAIIEKGDADMVAMARAFLDDPRWAWHAAQALGAPVVVPAQYQRATPKYWPLANTLRDARATSIRARE